MLFWINRSLRSRKGFTLVELVIVLVILGIIALIALPRIGGFQETAETRACLASQRSIESAAAAWYAENGEWPELGQLDDLVESTECPGEGTITISDGQCDCGEHGNNRD